MQDMERAIRTVVITGASSGIGQATVEAFAQDGVRLVIAARDGAALEDVAGRCRALGAEAVAVPADVTRPDEVAALARRAVEFGGGIDVWVSNVGIGAVGAFHEVPLEAHEQVIRANLIGHMNDAHAAIPVFLRQGHGIFVNMISLGGFAAAPFAAAYSASKFGLRGFAEALRGELAPLARHPCLRRLSLVRRHAGHRPRRQLHGAAAFRAAAAAGCATGGAGDRGTGAQPPAHDHGGDAHRPGAAGPCGFPRNQHAADGAVPAVLFRRCAPGREDQRQPVRAPGRSRGK